MIPVVRLEKMDLTSLVDVLRSSETPAATLTFAAEIAGRRFRDDTRVYVALLGLLLHDSSVVREGSLYGLGYFNLKEDAVRAISELAGTDVSQTIREIAEALLEDIGLNQERRALDGEVQCYIRPGMVCKFRNPERGCVHCGRLPMKQK